MFNRTPQNFGALQEKDKKVQVLCVTTHDSLIVGLEAMAYSNPMSQDGADANQPS
jgi:hypothetical protein